MSIYLQCILIIISLFSFIYILRSIRNSKVKLDYTFFWILFSLILLIFSIFPSLAVIGAKLIGMVSATNFVLVLIIFLLLYKTFTLTIQMSKLQEKIEELTQHIAMKENEEKDYVDENN